MSPGTLVKKKSETAVKCRFREVALRHCVCGICVKNSEISAYRGRRECGECEKMPNNEDEPFSRHPHYLHELPFEDEERLGKLFTQLDKDGNGKIDILDLSQALKEHGVHHHYAEKFLKSSKSKSGDLSLADFIYYVREHEKNLRLHFSHLDRNKDGKIDLEELIRAFSDLGIPLDRMEAKKLLQRMDQDGSLNISYDEWRDFLLLAPNSQDIHQLIIYWRHSTTSSPPPSLKFAPAPDPSPSQI